MVAFYLIIPSSSEILFFLSKFAPDSSPHILGLERKLNCILHGLFCTSIKSLEEKRVRKNSSFSSLMYLGRVKSATEEAP